VLCIAEGFATAATIHEVTGYPVAVAFTAGNLELVAQGLHRKFPDLQLIICADDDTATAGNPGLTKAKSAAVAVGAKVAIPEFGNARPHGVSDFNDVFQLHGPEAVKRSIERATATRLRSTATGFNLVSANEVLAAIEPETRWLWDGVLPEGGISLLVGKPKAGKSTLALALALAVSG
jgi:putative DNA primase/helicase